ncbi:uncharacterized protein YALI1_D27765g [Yarrowia lipolytica]|uniref:Uncharacterized protein n=1 Tax=Yarrowia lipolytica TaxID=4952 RepID=A0A1D8NFN7_YARLL|nr:hypothetical protein YALI1_D27765g [Yarrowia lipolytica]
MTISILLYVVNPLSTGFFDIISLVSSSLYRVDNVKSRFRIKTAGKEEKIYAKSQATRLHVFETKKYHIYIDGVLLQHILNTHLTH